MDLGIVIVNWNVGALLAACLDSIYLDLAQNSGQVSAAVCVVDNGSSDGSPAMLRRQFPRTLLIEADNRGMGAGNNVGLRALQAQIAPFAFLVLNPDTVIRPGALRQLAVFLRRTPRAGVVAPKLVNPDGSLQHGGFRFPGLIQAVLDLFPPRGRLRALLNSPLNGRYLARAYAGGQPFQVDHTLGAAFAVRAATLAECGLFDETFQLYCEEIDWQWRMARAGWQRWIVPAAEVIHHGGQSTRQAPADSLLKLWMSRRRLYHRYQSPAVNALLSPLVRLGMRRHIRANHRLSQRGQLTADERAAQNLALTEIIQVWQRRRPSL
ncbi:MAG: glycosyltransferase family 2 protein [Anaerolineales bacterium]|nr:glycosyltransferase family 2 protein [Anaerolineales bacterium]